MREIIISALIVLLAVVLVILLTGESSRIDDLRVKGTELEEEVKVYSVEKKALQNELKALEDRTVEKEKGVKSLLLVFKDTDEGFFSEIVPKLKENKLSATFCITKDDLPSNSGFTFEQIDELTELGWQSAMYWDGSEPIDTWYLDTTSLMTEDGVAIPDTLCIDRAFYNEIVAGSIKNFGFEHFILFNSPADDMLVSSDISFANSYPWYTTASSGALEALNMSDDKFGFVFGIESEEYLYKTKPFDNMLVKVLENVEKGKIIITTPDGAAQQTLINETEYKAALEEYNENITRIEAKIAEIDAKIEEICTTQSE